MRRTTALSSALILALSTSLGGAAPSLPSRLAETGLDGPGVQAYSPQYPLWTDGAAKGRWVFLPPGTRIDTRLPDRWSFPVGTKFWKEFAFAGRKVETRLIWKRGDQDWVYASYLWNAAGTEATLAPEGGVKDHAAIDGTLRHSIPSVVDCKACHENGGGAEILGFNALQLSTDRDPLALHAEPLQPGMATLATLEAQGRFLPPRPEWVSAPPRIQAASPRARAALGYLTANCGSCHKPENPIPRIDTSLRHPWTLPADASPVLKTNLGQPSKWWIPGLGADTLRLKAGSPEGSSVHYRMTRRGRATQMPPLGTVKVDEDAVKLLGAWIREDLK